MKVLIVDDVGYSRLFHSRMLQKLGHDTVIAESGTAALRVLERDMSINVVLTDLRMPEMDGLELFSAAQAIDRMTDSGKSDPPAFILMTAVRPENTAQPRDLERIRLAKQLGFVDILFKPIEQERLRTAIDIAISAGEPRIETDDDLDALTRQLRDLVDRIVDGDNAEAARSLANEIEAHLERLKDLVRPV